MKTIVDYVIISSYKGIENIETLIKQNINLGWQPIGGVTTMTTRSGIDNSIITESLIQAMVKYDD